MFTQFFLSSEHLNYYAYQSHYRTWVVIASIIIAIFSSFCALEMIERFAHLTKRIIWLPLGSILFGMGVWAMHFIGMLAFHLTTPISYNPFITTISVVPAILAGSVLLHTMSKKKPTLIMQIRAAIFITLGIGAMHFIGMSAMSFDGVLRYQPVLFFVALLVAFILAITVLVLRVFLTQFTFSQRPFIGSLLSGTLMGGSISGMHYFGMDASRFIHLHPVGEPIITNNTTQDILAIAVVCIAILLVLCGFLFIYFSTLTESFRERIQAILTTTQQGFIMIDTHSIVIEANDAMGKLLNCSAKTLLGRHYSELFADKICKQAFDNCQCEILLKPLKGEPLACLVTANAVKNSQGELLYSFALFSDISARKQAEKKLLRSEEKFRTLYDYTSQAVFLFADHRFIDCNTATLALFGCKTQAEFCSNAITDLSPNKQGDGLDTLFSAEQTLDFTIAQGHHRFEWLFKRFDNGQHFLAEVVLTVLELDGKPVLLGAMHDITLRKQYEKNLLQLAEAQTKLMQSEKMITVGYLAAGMAHEINTPIAFIRANLNQFRTYAQQLADYIYTFQEATDKDEQALPALSKTTVDIAFLTTDIFALIDESTQGLEHIHKLVDDLRTFSNEGKLALQWVDIHTCLNAALNLLINTVINNCQIHKQYSADMPLIYCYSATLNQVFMSLFVNSIEAMAANPSLTTQHELTVTTRACPYNAEAIQIIIADTGIGIAPEQLGRIFEPFYTTKHVGQGTGLGLFFAWNSIKEHGGTLDVASKVNRGTVITMTLPITAKHTKQ